MSDTRTKPVSAPSGATPYSAFKSHGGLTRILNAARYSWAGLRAAWQHEAAFRQELALGVPMVLAAFWVGQSAWEVLALVGVVVFVWVAELLNSAVETLADAVSVEDHPLIGRAKDIGSAAVMLSLLMAGATWGVALWALWAL